MYNDIGDDDLALQPFEDVEIIVQEEDTEPITKPIVQPLIIKRYSHQITGDYLPRTNYDFKFLRKLMEQDHAIRNVAFIGHLLHGKTSILDCLVEQTHPDFEQDVDKPVRYTDHLFSEQERGISIKASPISIVLQSLRDKSYLLNLMDTPGHVNFSDEVSTSLRLCDGVVLVVDAADGPLLNTERLLRHALREKLAITLCINKIDRLIFELRLPPSDVYHKFKRIIDEVNQVIVEEADESKLLSPLLGNVCFASSQYSVCFSLESFAKMYIERANIHSITYRQFASKLWGDNYLNPETSKFEPQPADRKIRRSFVEFILEPLYKFFRIAIEEPESHFLKIVEEFNIRLTNEQKRLNVKPLLRMVCSKFFGSFNSLVDMMANHVPTPKQNAARKCRRFWNGPRDDCDLTKALEKMDPEGILVVHVTKQFPSQDASTFNAFGRVMSGTLKSGSEVRILGESYSSYDDEDSRDLPIGRLWLCCTRYNVELRSIPAGNWALIEGIDQPIVKTATIIDMDYSKDLFIFRPLKFDTRSVIKIAIQPVNPSELPKMLDGMRKCDKSYPLLETKTEQSGEVVLIGTGELYLDCVMHDLRHIYSEIDIRVSDPVVRFSETIIEKTKTMCSYETANKRNEFKMIAEPLERGLDLELENEIVTLNSSHGESKKFFRNHYGWSELDCESIWAFGPETNSTNVLLDNTLEYEVDKTELEKVKSPIVQAFHWSTREGPLCEEPMRGVKFKLLEANIAKDMMHRGSGQIIPAARKLAYQAFLSAEPRMMEPYVFVEIVAPPDVVKGVQESSSGRSKYSKTLLEELIVDKRRGKIVKKIEMPGTVLFKVHAIMPTIDSFGFETDLRVRTTGQAFCQSIFDQWRVIPGDPLDKEVDKYLVPLEPQHSNHLAREFLLKTRRRKGLSEDVIF